MGKSSLSLSLSISLFFRSLSLSLAVFLSLSLSGLKCQYCMLSVMDSFHLEPFIPNKILTAQWAYPFGEKPDKYTEHNTPTREQKL